MSSNINRTRALIIDEGVRDTIRALKQDAAANPTPLDTVIAIAERRASGAMGLINPLHDSFTMGIPQGYRVTFTHEHQKQCECRHISISVDDAAPGTGPHPAAVAMILEEFGFINKIGHMPSWVGNGGDGRTIVEFIEPLDGNIDRLRRQDG